MLAKLKSIFAKIKALHLIIAVLTLGLIFVVYQYYKAQNELKIFKTSPEQVASKEVEKIVSEVSKLIDLPKDETPTIATVTDPQKLKDQTFFANAQEGDKVLIYNNARKAILYRPSEKKVINFAPINIGTDQNQPKSEEKAEINVKITILNGTKTAGLAAKYREKVKEKLPNAQILSLGNYQKDNVEKSFIAQSANSDSNQQAQIAKILEIETAAIDSGQIDEKADFIIVVGADQSSI